MKMSMKNTVAMFTCVLLLLCSSSCFVLVTGGDVDKEWPRNNSKNPHHSSTTNPGKADSAKVESISKPLR